MSEPADLGQATAIGQLTEAVKRIETGILERLNRMEARQDRQDEVIAETRQIAASGRSWVLGVLAAVGGITAIVGLIIGIASLVT